MYRRLISAILACVTTASMAAVPKADAYWRQGEYRRAFAEAFEPASRGDPHAQYLIGEAYRLGRSVDPNYPLAIEWYGRAARQGNLRAASELGQLLANQKAFEAALPWLKLAAGHGDVRALATLAAMYHNGNGVVPDEPLSLALIQRAAAAGQPDAKAWAARLQSQIPIGAQIAGEDRAREMLAANPVATVASAAPAPPPARPVRIQLGAYRSTSAAERAWSALRQHLHRPEDVDHAVTKAGEIYRLQVRFGDSAAADRFRRQLGAARWDYFLLE